jgi:4-hydroxybenzoate polyprenyltransferase
VRPILETHMQAVRRGRPVFLILAAANGTAGLAGSRSFLYVAPGCFLAWIGSVFFDPA